MGRVIVRGNSTVSLAHLVTCIAPCRNRHAASLTLALTLTLALALALTRNRRAASYSGRCRTRYLFDAFRLSAMASALNHQVRVRVS